MDEKERGGSTKVSRAVYFSLITLILKYSCQRYLVVYLFFLLHVQDKKNSKNPKAKPQLANIDGMDKTEIAFRLADKDKSGYITKSEFEKMAKNLSKEQIEKVFAKCDKDGDGKINFSEFSSMMAMAKK